MGNPHTKACKYKKFGCKKIFLYKATELRLAHEKKCKEERETAKRTPQRTREKRAVQKAPRTPKSSHPVSAQPASSLGTQATAHAAPSPKAPTIPASVLVHPTRIKNYLNVPSTTARPSSSSMPKSPEPKELPPLQPQQPVEVSEENAKFLSDPRITEVPSYEDINPERLVSWCEWPKGNYTACFRKWERVGNFKQGRTYRDVIAVCRLWKLPERPSVLCSKLSYMNAKDVAEFVERAKRAEAFYGYTRDRCNLPRRNTAHRRLAKMLGNPDFLQNMPAHTPLELPTLGYVEPVQEGLSTGALVAIPIATVLIGFTLFSSVRALLRRFNPKHDDENTK